MPAIRVSQKLSGAKRPEQRGIRFGPTEIDPTKLGQITLNRDAIQALTIAQAKVQVTISAGGTTAVLVSEETGKQIGGLDDLAKLLGLRSFVTKEKKMSASSDVQHKVIVAAFRAHEYLVSQDESFKQKKLDNTFIVATKPYRNMADQLEGRDSVIEANFNDSSEKFKPILRKYCKKTQSAVALTIAAMVKGEKEKGKFDSLLFDEGVPTYVKNKLLTKSLAISKDTDLSRILFPQDPSKGLALTVKEWRSDEFVGKQAHLLSASAGLLKIFRNEALFLDLIGMTAEQFSNAEDPRVQRVLKTRILVVPPFEDYRRVLEPLSRSNFRGFGLPATAMDQSKDRLSNLCSVFIRAYAFSVRMAETIPDFFERVLPAGTVKPVDDKLGNYAKQVLDAIESGVQCTLGETVRLSTNAEAMMHWIHRECKILPGGVLSRQIATTLGGTLGSGVSAVLSPERVPPRASLAFDPTDDASNGSEKDALKAFRVEAFSLKEKGSSKKRSVASSVLKREARTFLKGIAKDHSPVLSEAMEAYFRGFYSEDIQSAAVRIAEARFDEMDDLSEIGSSEEESSDEEDDAE